MQCDQVALLRLLIQETIGTILDPDNLELDEQLESHWQEFEDSFDEEKRMLRTKQWVLENL